jgi:Fe-S cluster assembly protein SufD
MKTEAIEEPVEMNEASPYVAAFDAVEAASKANEPSWALPLRKAGLSRFAELGVPTTKLEDWRFTNVASLTERPFALATAQTAVGDDALASLPFAEIDSYRLVFVDGLFVDEASTLPQTDGVIVTPMGAALTQHEALVQEHLGRLAKDETNAFVSLNDAYFQDGAFIHVARGKSLDKPVQLIFVSTGGESAAAQPRNLVIAEESTKLTLLETYAAAGGRGYFTNAVSEFSIGANAVVEHVKLQDEAESAWHLAALHADLGRDAHFVSHSFALGGRLSRNSIRTRLGGKGLNCVLNGLYAMTGNRLADHHMIVDHAEPHCDSHEYFNGILDDASRRVFHGRILVREDAQQTDAKQTNKNLLLSNTSTANTKPQLEIYADDVKCTHGATIGQLSDEQIFYLRARGIDLAEARRMLVHAFAAEIVDRIQCTAAREVVDQIVWNRLEQSSHV